MPNSQTGVVANYDFGAPNAEGIVLGFRVRNNEGGKVSLRFEMDATKDNTGSVTYSVQVAPLAADGVSPGTFADSAAANNLEAVEDVVVAPGTYREHELLLRPGVDAFVAVVASGGGRVQMQVRGDEVWDLWRTLDGTVQLTPV